MVPRSRSRVTASAVIITMVMGQDHGQQARHHVQVRLALGVVAALQHHIDGIGGIAQRD